MVISMKYNLHLIIRLAILIILIKLFPSNLYSDESESMPTILQGAVLLEDAESFDLSDVLEELKNKRNLNFDRIDIGKVFSFFNYGEYEIALVYNKTPITGDDIQGAAKSNIFWNDALNEIQNHKSHILIAIRNVGKYPIQENILFSNIVTALLNNSKSIGVYIKDRNLLLKKDFYLAHVEYMDEQNLPLYIWVYFGISKEDNKQSIYTYGLNYFNKLNLEIVNSSQSFNDLAELMYNLVHYIIASDVILKDGETVGHSEEQKLKVTYSPGIFLNGTTIKIDF